MTALDRLYVDGEILLYGDVGDPWGWGDGFTPSDVAKALALHGGADITVRLNSGGGIAFDGVAIYSLLRAHALTGGKVAIVVDGIAASAASLIAMAGDSIEMRAGAMMMIHDASGITWGTAEDHEKSRAMLDKLSGQYARVYADRSGKPEAEVRDLMLAETWFTAEEAVAAGLSTAVLSDAALSTAAFDYRVYAHAPDGLPRRVKTNPPAAAAAQHKEANMTVRTDPADPAKVTETKTEPQTTEKSWFRTFSASAEKSGLSVADVNRIADESADLATAQAKLIDAMAEASNKDKPKPGGSPATVTADARDKLIEGATKGILMRAGIEGGERNEFTGMRLERLAEEALVRAGMAATGNRLQMVGRAFTMIGRPLASGGMHSTGDFGTILEAVANKSMMAGWDQADTTYQLWTKKGSLSDFKIANRYGVGPLPMLKKKPEGTAYEYATLQDSKVTVMLATYGQAFSMTREMVINDDLDAFSDIPRKQGIAARVTVDSLPYALLIANGAFQGGDPLFHANRKNLSGIGGGAPANAAPSADSFEAVATWMRTKHVGGTDGKTRYRIRPKFGLFPVAKEFSVRQLLTSATELGQTNPALKNRAQGFIEPVFSDWLDDASATAWFFAADKTQDTIEVSFLDGVEEPFLDQENDWNVDGTKMKVRIDAGASALDPRGLFKNIGA
ncbi:ATP-dependent Clp protease proteolytic subunit ClpP [Bosea sp. LC85]|uniref:ClpP-like prohead protease/major capsid protein fusion protein n=1 Tax=Bosea sp. LC85 TaxID=1502851 RepID=UPI0004E31784|nr:ClpP-like prohead protease/major capsid protein fusion protein [Bosea sp. LC85]KFC63985.1 ATP-dependent Clp protease proteolytic subunit ClpP [Bosea sp. LC85]